MLVCVCCAHIGRVVPVNACVLCTHWQGGPNARSCHKMCLDTTNKQMFLLGRYLEPSLRTPEALRVCITLVVACNVTFILYHSLFLCFYIS